MMSDPDVEKYKVWPTQLDRLQFMDVITSKSRQELGSGPIKIPKAAGV
jgi:hypothetical protein